jgi:hypothetical protein
MHHRVSHTLLRALGSSSFALVLPFFSRVNKLPILLTIKKLSPPFEIDPGGESKTKRIHGGGVISEVRSKKGLASRCILDVILSLFEERSRTSRRRFFGPFSFVSDSFSRQRTECLD